MASLTQFVILGALCLAACRAPAPPPEQAPAAPAPAPEAKEAKEAENKEQTLHFAKLRPFAPDELQGWRGKPARCMSSRQGKVAVSEVIRPYVSEERALELRIMDTNMHSGLRVGGDGYEDAERLTRPIRLTRTVGYVEFDKKGHRARADLLVAERVLVTLICDDAKSAEEVERLAAGLDLAGLAHTVR